MELASKGCKFTWMNNQEGDEPVEERLDRALCMMDWRLLFTNVDVFLLSAVGFDHSPLIINTSANYRRRVKNFVYESYWNDDEECRGVISDAWNSVQIPGLDFYSKLKKVSLALTKCNWSKFTRGYLKV